METEAIDPSERQLEMEAVINQAENHALFLVPFFMCLLVCMLPFFFIQTHRGGIERERKILVAYKVKWLG